MFQFKNFFGCVVLRGLLLIISFTTDCEGINPYSLVTECPPPLFKNGKVRTKQRGRLVTYRCHEGYELLGQRYTTCINGSWDSPPPICISPGCPKIYAPENGIHHFTMKNAAVIFFCNTGYTMVGSDFVYCNEMRWNGTTPKCERLTDSPDMSTQKSSTEDASSVPPPPLPPSLKMTPTNSPNNTNIRKESLPTLIPANTTIEYYALTTKPNNVTTSTQTTINTTIAKQTLSAKPATVRQATTTTKIPVTVSNISYTISKPMSTTPKLIKTSVINLKVVPTLQFLTPSPPVINVTGILNVDPQKKDLKNETVSTVQGKNDRTNKNYTVNLDRYVLKIFNMTKDQFSTATTKTISHAQTVGYSKTFKHYSVLPPGYTTNTGSDQLNATIRLIFTAVANGGRKMSNKHDNYYTRHP